MPAIERETVKDIVRRALRLVASFSGEFEAFSFRNFKQYHKRVFLDSIKNQLRAMRINDFSHYDIRLRMTDLDEWDNFKECIDWVRANVSIKVSVSDLSLGRAELKKEES